MSVACTHRLAGSQGAAEVGSEVALSCSTHIAWDTGIYFEIAGHTCSVLPGLSGANTKKVRWHALHCTHLLFCVPVPIFSTLCLLVAPTGPSTALFCPPNFSSLASPFSPDHLLSVEMDTKARRVGNSMERHLVGTSGSPPPCSPQKSPEEFYRQAPQGPWLFCHSQFSKAQSNHPSTLKVESGEAGSLRVAGAPHAGLAEEDMSV